MSDPIAREPAAQETATSSSTPWCAQHPKTAAHYRCDGCGKFLCAACAEQGHALLFCRRCGERAIPLERPQPAEQRRPRRRRAHDQPYTLADVLRYPFRGTGASVYVATLVMVALLFVLPSCLLRMLFIVLVASLQLRVVRATAEGADELPGWPLWSEPGERMKDLVVWLAASMLQFLGLSLLVSTAGSLEVLLGRPSLAFWIAAAAALWLGTGMSLMALGAAVTFARIKVVSVPAHVLGFVQLGAEAVNITNWVFGLGAAVLIARSIVETLPPVLSIPLSGALGAYWMIVQPHLAGVMFRRNYETLEAFYAARSRPA